MSIFSKSVDDKYFTLINNQVVSLENISSKKPSIDGKAVQIKTTIEYGLNYIHFGDKKYLYEIVEQKQNNIIISINGIQYNVSVETEFSLNRKKILEATKQEKNILQLIAPMPGKIIDVFAEEGSMINEGDTILILEAMKMQNEILAPRTGIVRRVFVKPEQNIMKEDVLVVIE